MAQGTFGSILTAAAHFTPSIRCRPISGCGAVTSVERSPLSGRNIVGIQFRGGGTALVNTIIFGESGRMWQPLSAMGAMSVVERRC